MAELGESQFRESAFARNAEPEPLDDRAQLTAPHEWVVLACLGLVAAAIIAWGVFGSVERTVRSDGVLVLSGDRHTVLSEESGVVVEVLTPAGNRVDSGQPIVRIAASGPERTEGDVTSPGDGVIATLHVARGRTVLAGTPVAEVVSGGAHVLDAVAFVPRQESWRLAPGMAGRVTVESSGSVGSFRVNLTTVGTRAAEPPDWLVRMQPSVAAGGRGHLLRLTFSDPVLPASSTGNALPGSLEDGTPCRIEIVLERTSPFGLLLRL